MFAAGKGTPLHLDNLVRRIIQPLLEKAGIEWRGWHAFRRGLATTLQVQGVPIKTAQAILRHADHETTANHYIKTVEGDAVEAMSLVEKACNERAMEAFKASGASVIN